MIVAALSDIRAQVREMKEEIESWSNKWKLLHEEELKYRETREHDEKRRSEGYDIERAAHTALRGRQSGGVRAAAADRWAAGFSTSRMIKPPRHGG
jgi:hypothetical protein